MRTYAAVLAVLSVLVWATGLDGVFLYDDYDSIVLNPYIRRLWPLSDAMSRPLADAAETVSTRPLLSLTFALNYAVHGLDVTGYHVVNIVVHLAAALLLFAFLRGTLASAGAASASPAVAARADAIAFTVTLLWALHPLHTSSVTYVVQRAEALGGLFVLAALYCAWRAATTAPDAVRTDPPRTPASASHGRTDAAARPGGRRTSDAFAYRHARSSRLWTAGAIVACWLGTGAKETIAAAPLLALVHAATFVDGSYRVALARRWRLYAGMATSWVGLAWLLSSDTGELAAAGTPYLLAQPAVLLRYVRLVLWPAPLAMTYDWPAAESVASVAAPLLVVGAAAAATLWGVVRKRWWGFAGAAWFAVLAPSSSVFGLTQLIMEHRTYLPAAVVITLAVLGVDALARVFGTALVRRSSVAAAVSAPALVAAAALALAGLTIERNRDYASEVSFWEENVAVQPADSIAHLQLGRAYLRADDAPRAQASFERAVALGPPFAPAHNDLARALIVRGDLVRADAELDRALALDPRLAVAHFNAGLVAERRGSLAAAAERYRRALALDASLEGARHNLARVLARSGDHDEAAAAIGLGERGDPHAVTRAVALAASLERDGSIEPALALFERAAAAAPADVTALNALATALARAGRDEEALRRFDAVLALDARNLDAHRNLGALHASRGRSQQAIEHFEQALATQPDAALVHFNLGLLAESGGDLDGALDHYAREVRLNPSFAPAHVGCGRVLELRGRRAEAALRYEAALRLSPELAEARSGLDRVRARSETGS